VLPKETICIRFRNMYTGEWEYIEKEFAVILSRTGEVETIIGTHKDVTKRVREAERVDELLTKCRKLYNENQTILNSLPIGVSIYNKDGDLVYFNQSNAKMFQMRDQEMVYQAKFNLWKHPYMGSDLRRILDGEKETIFTYQVDCSRLPIEYCIPSDRFLNISCYSNVVKNEAGEVESYIFLHRDITLQEEQARKMKDMSETLMRVIDASGFSVWEFSIKERKFYSYRGNICVEDGTSYEDTIAAYTPESAQLCEKVFHNLINGVSEAEHAIFESF
ncbi:MAG: PAS domain-containing protein, partial [Rikenellaceae bacterium]